MKQICDGPTEKELEAGLGALQFESSTETLAASSGAADADPWAIVDMVDDSEKWSGR